MDFFTSDWHLNDELIREKCGRKFKDAARMNEVFIKTANQRAHKNDVILHVGDFIQRGMDRGTGLAREKQLTAAEAIEKLDASIFLFEGNHDENNRANAVGRVMFRKVGKFDCVVQHLPSTSSTKDLRPIFPAANGYLINICGHVHNAWQFFVDQRNRVVNFNVGIDIYPYMIKECDLAQVIAKTLAKLSIRPTYFL